MPFDDQGPDIQQLRVDLAAALRLADRQGLSEGIDNHFSVAIDAERFLVNPYGPHWSEMRASDMLTITLDGEVENGDGPADDTAFFIHSRIHALVPRARAVLHTHMPYATTLACLETCEILPISQNAMDFVGRTAHDPDYNGLVFDAAEGDRLAALIEDADTLFLANHGVIVIGPTIAEAYQRLYFLERVCQLQVLALSTGQPLRRVPAEVVAKTALQVRDGVDASSSATFAAWKRLLDRDGADYAA